MDALKLMSESCLKKDLPVVNVGDTVRVQVRIQEGNRERLQAFEGTVIAKKHGGIAETFTVRRLSHGCGVERVFPIHSPKVASVELVRKGRVRRGKLYYLRGRVGNFSTKGERTLYGCPLLLLYRGIAKERMGEEICQKRCQSSGSLGTWQKPAALWPAT